MKSIASMLAFIGCMSATFASMTNAAEIKVMSSGGFRSAYLALVPEFERATGHKVVSTWGGSMGSGPNTIPNRLKRGETADVVILAGDSLDELIKQGHVAAGSRADLARSVIGVAVRAGAPKPDISSTEAVIRALDQAKSIAYSSSASGVYLSSLFRRLGIWDRVSPKIKQVSGEPVAAVVARGEADIGFQQISELLPVPGIEYIGPLPADIQEVTIFSAGIASGAKEPAAASALIKFMTAPAAAPLVRKSGMEPI